ncbi:hypothetical protein JM946_07580 [Steroidobacter sp. S1-65]|uniref:Zinc-finger domain-containing protein n=1 Tax=Steroidobacter gossypii TaxID=2805490 RepID=A0ABS1WUF5_9GAMM|nr:hypothetical protein [Steroidobacter gossypii]MBM0104601.1 hypothetical protein [Steroidobacter gossypii]
MHARIEHLLSLRDGEPVPVEVTAHLKACPACTAELQRLTAIRAEMQALPDFEPPEFAWEGIRDAISYRERGVRPRKVGLAAAAAAVVTVSVIALIASYADRRSTEVTTVSVHGGTSPEEVVPRLDELVAQSQQLEQLLRKLPERPRIERVSTAATIDTIQQRIQWLDFQLTNVPEGTLSQEQSRQLWRERVELMDSLVKVRYAEAGAVWF